MYPIDAIKVRLAALSFAYVSSPSANTEFPDPNASPQP